MKLWGSKKWCKSGAKSLIIGTRYMQWGSEQANSVLSPLNQLAMLPLYVKSEEWKKIPLLGYGVHISNKVGDFTTTIPCSLLSLQYVQLLEVGADFLFHPEGFSYHCYQNCLVLQSPNCKHMKDVSKYMLCLKCIFCNSSNFSAYKITVDMLMLYYFHSYSVE